MQKIKALPMLAQVANLRQQPTTFVGDKIQTSSRFLFTTAFSRFTALVFLTM
jgi:hypothetical protein